MRLNFSRMSSRRSVVWAVPVLTIAAVVGSGLAISSASANSHPVLAARTAAQLLAAVRSSAVQGLSGTVVETARLGLPSLPGADGGASLSWQSLVTGSHTAQVWIDGADRQRVAVQGSLAESDVIHNGADLWIYTSNTNQVTHTVLTGKDGSYAASGTSPDARSLTPQGAAQQALTAINPTTAVRVDSTQVVAGQAAYTLVLTPRDARSTVRQVTIAIDGTHFVPLQVQVFGAGSLPVFQTGFVDGMSFSTPKASVFDFRAPAGSTVGPDPFGMRRHADKSGPGLPSGSVAPGPSTKPKIIGTGWTAIAELPAGLPAGSASALLDKLTTPVGTTGDKLLATSLLNVLILDDGRVFIGAVSASMLEQTAAATPR